MDSFSKYEVKGRKQCCCNIRCSHALPPIQSQGPDHMFTRQKTIIQVKKPRQKNTKIESQPKAQCDSSTQTDTPKQHVCQLMARHCCDQHCVKAQRSQLLCNSLGHGPCPVQSPIMLRHAHAHPENRQECNLSFNNVSKSRSSSDYNLIQTVSSDGTFDSNSLFNRECEDVERLASPDVSSDTVSTNLSRKTVISAKTGRNLKDIVLSQIKTQELIKNAIDKLETSTSNTTSTINGPSEQTYRCKPKALPKVDNNPVELSRTKYLSSHAKDVTNSIVVAPNIRQLQVNESGTNHLSTSANNSINTKAVGPLMRGLHLEKLTFDNSGITIEDVIDLKIVAPIMRSVQCMYIDTLQEELSLMQTLYNFPSMLGEIFHTDNN